MQVATGLLIAEVNVNTMCELGSGGVSLVIMLQIIDMNFCGYILYYFELVLGGIMKFLL